MVVSLWCIARPRDLYSITIAIHWPEEKPVSLLPYLVWRCVQVLPMITKRQIFCLLICAQLRYKLATYITADVYVFKVLTFKL